MDYTLKNGNSKSEILTTIEIRFTWVDCESGETLVSHFAANGQNDWDKGLGSALTYAERYYLLKFFHIPTDEDDVDAKAPQSQGTTAQPDLPWLNKDTEAFNQAKAYIANGGGIADIRKKYKVSKEVEGLLK
jgi:hypothetical protein